MDSMSRTNAHKTDAWTFLFCQLESQSENIMNLRPIILYAILAAQTLAIHIDPPKNSQYLRFHFHEKLYGNGNTDLPKIRLGYLMWLLIQDGD